MDDQAELAGEYYRFLQEIHDQRDPTRSRSDSPADLGHAVQ